MKTTQHLFSAVLALAVLMSISNSAKGQDRAEQFSPTRSGVEAARRAGEEASKGGTPGYHSELA